MYLASRLLLRVLLAFTMAGCGTSSATGPYDKLKAWADALNVQDAPRPAKLQPAARTAVLFKFHALITSYEVIKQDLAVLKKIPWRYMVIDEAHRLKNKDSALANDLRQLSVEHMHLLSGTPLQNNTTELWALLNFLDPALFKSLDDFHAEFGTLTDAAQIDMLNERVTHSPGLGRDWRAVPLLRRVLRAPATLRRPLRSSQSQSIPERLLKRPLDPRLSAFY